MKLVSFQNLEAVKDLFQKGYLTTDERFVNVNKVGKAYAFIIDNMNAHLNNQNDIKYPVWCWVKYNNSISPPKHKGKKIDGFDVKLTFHKNKEEVFITDYKKYSFLLNYRYIPSSIKDKIEIDNLMKKHQISNEELLAYIRKDKFKYHRLDENYLKIIQKIEKSFHRCISEDGSILQGCVWEIRLSEIEKIEFLNDENYIYGSVNYVHKNGLRHNWIEEVYKELE